MGWRRDAADSQTLSFYFLARTSLCSCLAPENVEQVKQAR